MEKRKKIKRPCSEAKEYNLFMLGREGLNETEKQQIQIKKAQDQLVKLLKQKRNEMDSAERNKELEKLINKAATEANFNLKKISRKEITKIQSNLTQDRNFNRYCVTTLTINSYSSQFICCFNFSYLSTYRRSIDSPQLLEPKLKKILN